MYHWVEDKDFLKRAYSESANIVNQLVQELKRFDIESEMNVVGSKRRNMITQNAEEPIDFDFNLLIINADEYHNARDLKEDIREAFDTVLLRNGWGDSKDSTSVLTTEKRHFKKGNKTEFYIDVCIVKVNEYGVHRLIHKKTGFVSFDQYTWEVVPDSRELWHREQALKPDYWLYVRETYLDKKKMYQRRPYDHEHSSMICYIEAVNEIYNKVQQGFYE